LLESLGGLFSGGRFADLTGFIYLVVVFTIAVNGSYPCSPSPPRPQIALRAREDLTGGRITGREYARALERATVEAVAEMVAAGVEVVSDGQIRWEGPAEFICRGQTIFLDAGTTTLQIARHCRDKRGTTVVTCSFPVVTELFDVATSVRNRSCTT
jgi:hypothetical protein